jgi:hypothetical protein
MSQSAAPPAVTSVVDRAAIRTMSQRRRRVWINVAVFVLVTTVMVLLSMAQRDYQSVRDCWKRMNGTGQELQKLLSRGEAAPLLLPLPQPRELPANASQAERDRRDDEFLLMRQHYFYNAHYGRPQAQQRQRPVGVCCCAALHHLYLRTNGRHVIVFDGQRYELRWLTESEFRRQAAVLELVVPEQP